MGIAKAQKFGITKSTKTLHMMKLQVKKKKEDLNKQRFDHVSAWISDILIPYASVEFLHMT